MPNISIDIDAFSSGQIGSKIWLAETLENLGIEIPQVIWVYGGWYGMLSFLLLARNKFPIKHIRSFDIDPVCQTNADYMLENWVYRGWKFKAFTADCSNLVKLPEYGDEPSLIINTSSEHFYDDKWYQNIPSGTMVAIQSNNMVHDDHFMCMNSVGQLLDTYKMTSVLRTGKLNFKYPDWEFNRYMVIGYK